MMLDDELTQEEQEVLEQMGGWLDRVLPEFMLATDPELRAEGVGGRHE